MKAISDLNRLGSTVGSAFRVGAASIAIHSPDRGSMAQPPFQAFRRSIRKEIYYPVPFQIHQNRAVVLPSSPGPIVYSKMMDGFCILRWR